MRALQIIKYFAIAAVFIVGAKVYIFVFVPGTDDVAAAVFKRILQNAVDVKSENDLTI